MRNQKIYEKFPEVESLRKIIENNEQMINKMRSAEYIENSTTVKELRKGKKELDDKYAKKNDDLQTQIQELQKEINAKQEQIQNLVFRQKNQRKGIDFEQ